MKILMTIVLLSLLSGCAMFDQAADKIASGVIVYCEQNYVYRSEFRNTINAHLTDTGHRVHVHCSGDPDTSGLTPDTGSFCMDAPTKTQDGDCPQEEKSWLDQDIKLTLQSQPPPPLLKNSAPIRLTALLLPEPRWSLHRRQPLMNWRLHSALWDSSLTRHSQILPQLKLSLPQFASNSVSNWGLSPYNLNSPGFNNTMRV